MMGVRFQHIEQKDETEYQVHFCVKQFIQSKEYQLTIQVQDGRAVKIMDGDCINSDGWFNWDQVAEESELLEVVNELYEEEFKK